MATPAIDLDGPWKEALDAYLEEALALLFPLAHDAIDWTSEPRPRDKELQQIAPEGGQGGQTVDKLVEVRLRDGGEVWVLIHLEIQSQHAPTFARRMFRYHARIFDRYLQDVVSLAVLGDTRAGWRPDRFGYDRLGCELRLTFPIAKLVKFDRAGLEASANPFATVVLAHLDAQATRNDPPGRARAKFALTRRLYGLGYDREAIRRLYRFIDWILRLPKELDIQTWQQIKAFEEEQQMPYITFAERYGREAGLAEGIVIGIAIALETKFGEAGSALVPEIQQIADPERLETIIARIRTATSAEEVRSAYAEGA